MTINFKHEGVLTKEILGPRDFPLKTQRPDSQSYKCFTFLFLSFCHVIEGHIGMCERPHGDTCCREACVPHCAKALVVNV